LQRARALLTERATADKLTDGDDERANAMIAILDNALTLPGASSQ
jgi:hypothetical protein